MRRNKIARQRSRWAKSGWAKSGLVARIIFHVRGEKKADRVAASAAKAEAIYKHMRKDLMDFFETAKASGAAFVAGKYVLLNAGLSEILKRLVDEMNKHPCVARRLIRKVKQKNLPQKYLPYAFRSEP